MNHYIVSFRLKITSKWENGKRQAENKMEAKQLLLAISNFKASILIQKKVT